MVPDIFSRNNMSFVCVLCKTCTRNTEEYKLVYIKVTHVSLNQDTSAEGKKKNQIAKEEKTDVKKSHFNFPCNDNVYAKMAQFALMLLIATSEMAGK